MPHTRKVSQYAAVFKAQEKHALLFGKWKLYDSTSQKTVILIVTAILHLNHTFPHLLYLT